MKAPASCVLSHADAAQMMTDLGTAAHSVVALAEQSSDVDKVLAFDTVALLLAKRSLLESELCYTRRPTSEAPAQVGGEEPAGLAEQEHSAMDAVEALRLALASYEQDAGSVDYEGSARICNELARAAQLAATELAKTAACYQMARAIGAAEVAP